MFKGVGGVKKLYPRGGVLHYEEDESSKVIVLVSGGCKAYKMSRDSEIFLYSLCAGAVISDLGGVALSSVEFTCDSEVMIYEFSELDAGELLFYSIERTKVLSSALDVVSVFDALGKVCNFILNDLEGFNSLKRVEVARRLSMSPETLSRILHEKLKDVVNSNKVITILDEDKLRSFL